MKGIVIIISGQYTKCKYSRWVTPLDVPQERRSVANAKKCSFREIKKHRSEPRIDGKCDAGGDSAYIISGLNDSPIKDM